MKERRARVDEKLEGAKVEEGRGRKDEEERNS